MKILLIGDVMIGRLVNDWLKSNSPHYPWGDVLPILENADLRTANLECAITDNGQPWSATPKIFHFRTDAKNAGVIKEAGIDGVTLANNHALDYDFDGLVDTINILDKAGIKHAGAGLSLEEAMKPAVFTVGKTRIALVSFTDNEPAWQADEGSPGIFYVPIDENSVEALTLFELIRQTKRQADLVIAGVHWGPNWNYNPPASHMTFSRRLIDAGADIIYGHSPHIFRGVEIYGSKPILYSTGNFIDDYAVDEIERNDESFIFIADISGQKIRRLELYPTLIKDFQARLAKGKDAARIIRKMQMLCDELGTKSTRKTKKKLLEIFIDR